jgi:hypothetical protein
MPGSERESERERDQRGRERERERERKREREREREWEERARESSRASRTRQPHQNQDHAGEAEHGGKRCRGCSRVAGGGCSLLRCSCSCARCGAASWFTASPTPARPALSCCWIPPAAARTKKLRHRLQRNALRRPSQSVALGGSSLTVDWEVESPPMYGRRHSSTVPTVRAAPRRFRSRLSREV